MGQTRDIRDFFASVNTQNVSNNTHHVEATTHNLNPKLATNQVNSIRGKKQPSHARTRKASAQSASGSHERAGRRKPENRQEVRASVAQPLLCLPCSPEHAGYRSPESSRHKQRQSTTPRAHELIDLPLRSPVKAALAGTTEPQSIRCGRVSCRRSLSPEVPESPSDEVVGRRAGGKRTLAAVVITPPPPGHFDVVEHETPSSLLLEATPPPQAPESQSDASSCSPSPTPAAARRNMASKSRRTIERGINVVTNSDSGSDLSDLDDSDDNDEQSLEHVSKSVPPKCSKLAPPKSRSLTPANNDSSIPTRRSPRLMAQSNGKLPQFTLNASPPRQVYRHSLADMVAQKRKRQEDEARILALENEIRQAREHTTKDRLPLQTDQVNCDTVLSSEKLDNDMRPSDPDTNARLEALPIQEEHYHFFLDHVPLAANTAFPQVTLRSKWKHVLADLFEDHHSWAQACCNGFVKAAMSVVVESLPLEVVLWMGNQLAHESNDEICKAYVQTIKTCIEYDSSISAAFNQISAFYKTNDSSTKVNDKSAASRLPPGLPYLLEIVSFAAPISDVVGAPLRQNKISTSESALVEAIIDLALARVDSLVQRDASLSNTIAASIEAMLELTERLSHDSAQKLPLDVAHALRRRSHLTPLTRCHMILAMPATTVLAAQLRRRLALKFFTQLPQQELADADLPSFIVKALEEDPAYTITSSTDYNLLASAVNLLDIAIGPGFLDVAVSIEPPKDGSSASAGALPAKPPSAAKNMHNTQVDAIAFRLQAMSSRIRVTNTSQLDGAEARDRLERVTARLLHSVRTRPRSRKGIFDNQGVFQSSLGHFLSGASSKTGPAVGQVSGQEAFNALSTSHHASSESDDEDTIA